MRDDVSIHSQDSSTSSVVDTGQVPPHQLLQEDEDDAQFSEEDTDHVPSGQVDPADNRVDDEPFMELDSNVPSAYESLTEEEQPTVSIPEQAMAIDYSELLHLVAQRSGFSVGEQFVARNR